MGVNAHLLSLAGNYRSAGINWYIYNLLRCLPAAAPEIEYTIFTGESRYSAQGVTLRRSSWPTHRPPVRIIWEQIVQPVAARRAGVDLLHGPAFVGPLVGFCPTVITIHDLSFLLYPQNFRAGNRLYLQILTRLSVRRARRLIAVSESTKRDLIRHYQLPPERVDVVPNGVDDHFRPWSEAEIAAFRTRKGLPERFLLFVGTLEPRKNVVGLIQAYARLPQPRPPLMLVGGKGWLYDEIFTRVETLGLSDEVHFVGYVSAEDLPGWYNAARLFVYPSLYEGFGLPPLEAMACGTPVVASNASSLPEVVGRAGLLVDPNDAEALTAAMNRLLTDGDLHDALQVEGPKRAAAFSWQETARRTAAVYRRSVIAEGGKERV